MPEQKESRELALKEKVHLIRFLETNSQRKTAKQFHVSRTTVSNIQCCKREYLERCDEKSGDTRRKRRTSFDKVNETALSLSMQMRAANARISGPMIQEVARRFAVEFRLTGFRASSGWLEKLKLYHKISQNVLCGEANEVLFEVLEDFIAKFCYFASGFEEEDIFNPENCSEMLSGVAIAEAALTAYVCSKNKH